MDVIFSGIQPRRPYTGKLSWGIEEFYSFQDKAECFYCIVNQHAITVRRIKLLHERTETWQHYILQQDWIQQQFCSV